MGRRKDNRTGLVLDFPYAIPYIGKLMIFLAHTRAPFPESLRERDTGDPP